MNMAEANERFGNPAVLTGEPAKSGLWVPLIVGRKAIGVGSSGNRTPRSIV